MDNYYPNILDSNQKSVLSRLGFLKKYGFYLAGGTALSLQIEHRTSVDLDFFTSNHFDSNLLYARLEKEFEESAKKTGQEKDTLFVKIKNVDVSFFWYKFAPIKRGLVFKSVSLASLEDIAAMKLLAITHRPAKRDYIDIYFLLQKFSIKKIFSYAEQKYPNFNDYLALRALTYFEDIKEPETKRPIKVISQSFSWEEAKKFIFDEVKKFQLSIFKK